MSEGINRRNGDLETQILERIWESLGRRDEKEERGDG